MAIEANKSLINLEMTSEMLEAISSRINENAPSITGVKVNGEVVEPTDKVVELTIPTAVSDLEGADELATKTDVAEAVAGVGKLSRKIVASTSDIDVGAADAEDYIYMVKKATGADGDEYDEYMVIDGKLEKVGGWEVDLTNFVEKEEGKGLSTNDFTDEDKAKLESVAEDATKVEATEGTGAITIDGTEVQLLRVATEEEFKAMLTMAGFGTEEP